MNSAFKTSLPLTVTTFVNRCGTIAISLVPILLVSKQIEAGKASVIMTLIKSGLIAGTLLGGIVTDYMNPRLAVLLSFLISGIGFAAAPFISSIWIIAFLLFLANTGQGMFPSASRLLLTKIVERKDHQEAIGWVRMANNAGMIVSYAIGAFFSQIGVLWLIFFDGATSLLAVALGGKIIPPMKKDAPDEEQKNRSVFDKMNWKLIIFASIFIGAFNVLYELTMTGVAGLIQKNHGEGAVKYFSYVMLINVIICSIFSVPASRYLKNPNRVFPAGMFFLTLGSVLMFSRIDQLPFVYTGAFFLTIGELFFFALASFTLVRVTPDHGNKGSFFGSLMLFQMATKTLGAGLAFNLVVYRPYGVISALVLLLLFLIFWKPISAQLKQAVE